MSEEDTSIRIPDALMVPVPCPSWCTLPEGHDLPLEFGDGRWHGGATFGRFLAAAFDGDNGREIGVRDEGSGAEFSPGELWVFAAQATAAAEWLEEHR